MVMKKILIALALLLTGIASGSACTGISFLAEDGGYVQARTIEWGNRTVIFRVNMLLFPEDRIWYLILQRV